MLILVPILLLVCIWLSAPVISQAPSCFRDSYTDVFLFNTAGSYILDLDPGLAHLAFAKYEVEISPVSENGMIREYQTFSKPSELSPVLQHPDQLANCVESVASFRGRWLFLCSNSSIVSVTVDSLSHQFTADKTRILDLSEQLTKPLKKGLVCSSISSGNNYELFVVCRHEVAVDNIHLFSVDIASLSVLSYKEIAPQDQQRTLKGSLEIKASYYSDGDKTFQQLFVYERSPQPSTIRLMIFTCYNDDFSEGEFFSSSLNSIKNFPDAPLKEIVPVWFFDFLYLRGDRYLRKCGRKIEDGVLVCEPNQLSLTPATGMVKIFQIPPAVSRLGLLKLCGANTTEILCVTLNCSQNEFINNTERISVQADALGRILDFEYAKDGYAILGSREGENPDKPAMVIRMFSQRNNHTESLGFSSTTTQTFLLVDKSVSYSVYQMSFEPQKLYLRTFFNNSLQIFTKENDKKHYRLNVTLVCKLPPYESSESTSFSVEIMPVFDLNLTNIEDFAGAANIKTPIYDTESAGNGIYLSSTSTIFKLTGTATSRATVTMDLPNSRDLVVENILNIGEGYFALLMEDQVRVLRCSEEQQEIGCTSAVGAIDLKSEKLTYLDSAVEDGILTVILTTTRPADQYTRDRTSPITLIRIYDLAASLVLLKETEYSFFSRAGCVKPTSFYINAFLVANPTWDSPGNNLYSLDIPKNTREAEPEPAPRFELNESYCPVAIATSPTSLKQLYLTSKCDSGAVSIHKIQLPLDFSSIAPNITLFYQAEANSVISLCVQEDYVTVVDYNKQTVFALVSNLTHRNRRLVLPYPLQEYGVDKIVAHTCDQKSGLLQVLGETVKFRRYLLTYRANLAHIPNKRLHSVIQVHPDVRSVALSSDGDYQKAVTLLFGRSAALFEAYRTSPTAVEQLLDTSVSHKPGTFFNKQNYSVPGLNSLVTREGMPLTIIAEYTLKMVAFDRWWNFALKNPQNKIKAENTLQNIEDYVTITGPYHSLVQDAGSKVQLIDRIPKDSVFDDMQEKFERFVGHGVYAYGYSKETNGTYSVSLYQTGSLIKKTSNLQRVSDLQFVAKSDNEFYFFALVRNLTGHWRLCTSFTTNAGHSWEHYFVAMHPVEYYSFRVQHFELGYWFFAAYTRVGGNRVITAELQFNSDRLWCGPSLSYRVTGRITEFEFLWVPRIQTGVVIIQQDSQLNTTFLRLVPGTYNQVEVGQVQHLSLVGSETPVTDPKFKCQIFKEKVEESDDNVFISCVVAARGLYSYVVNYQLDWTKPTTGLARNFITSTTVQAKLRNIVNLTPKQVTFQGPYIAILTENEYPQTPQNKFDVGAVLPEKQLCLVYKLDSSMPSMSPSKSERFEVFRILNPYEGEQPANLTVTGSVSLFVIQGNSSRSVADKLGMFVSTRQKQYVRAYRLEGLSIEQRSYEEINPGSELKFRTLTQDSIMTVKAGDFFAMPSSKSGGLLGSSSTVRVILGIAFGSLILVPIICCAVSHYRKSSNQRATKQPDDTSEPDLESSLVSQDQVKL